MGQHTKTSRKEEDHPPFLEREQVNHLNKVKRTLALTETTQNMAREQKGISKVWGRRYNHWNNWEVLDMPFNPKTPPQKKQHLDSSPERNSKHKTLGISGTKVRPNNWINLKTYRCSANLYSWTSPSSTLSSNPIGSNRMSKEMEIGEQDYAVMNPKIRCTHSACPGVDLFIMCVKHPIQYLFFSLHLTTKVQQKGTWGRYQRCICSFMDPTQLFFTTHV